MEEKHLRRVLNQHGHDIQRMLDEFRVGQQQAMACLARALAAAVGDDALAHHLRAQLIALPSPYDASLHPMCEDLLRTMWQAIRPPRAAS